MIFWLTIGDRRPRLGDLDQWAQRVVRLLPIWLFLLVCSCGKPAYDDPRRNRLPGAPKSVLGKWETLMVRHVSPGGLPLPYREVWGSGQTGKGFEFCPDAVLKVYSFTNATPPGGRPLSTFSLTGTGQYTLTNGILEVRLNGEVASTAFPPVPPADPAYKRLPKRAQSEGAGANFLTLTNQAGVAGSIGLLKVSKFKFE